jgi:hypothetical protein
VEESKSVEALSERRAIKRELMMKMTEDYRIEEDPVREENQGKTTKASESNSKGGGVAS